MSGFDDFLDTKHHASMRIASKRAAAGRTPTYTMRLRIRVGHRFNSDATKIKATFRGRRITILSRDQEKPLKESEWIVLLATRFKTADAAADYGLILQKSLSIGAAIGNIPIDIGADNLATGSWSAHVKEALAKEGTFLADDVHGLTVYSDTVTAITIFFSAELSASINPDRVLELAEMVGAKAKKIDKRCEAAALLMNAALLTSHPAAIIVLGISAIELLAEGERWTQAQLGWIRDLSVRVASSDGLTVEEKEELAKAVSNLNFGVAEKNRRLIKDLGLDSIIPRWTALYRGRSKLVHGLGHIPYNQLVSLASDARELTKAIFDAYVARQLGIRLPL
ncbi:hypothetical protein CN200_29625 [Sinorhizobium meliloti]|uniref:hypothetical protein n=1 Tax=Rhizobium meliloti TaxID=382 RepID=UPI000FD38541|nr:hypothetical protein [Sinorhizobium meliloti]RVI07877.1 hypothetical protein CN200_29625 [Sinorhizobium meliloti]RVN80884.1 hypothetical protein CN107_27915 [Sinorhizobium meliloti]RVO00304.1 hypothetical protein CN103_29685 [Sinorhizobium meliloti]